MVRFASKHLDGNYRLFELVIGAVRPGTSGIGSSAHSERTRGSSGRLPTAGARRRGLQARGARFRVYILFSAMCKCMKHTFNEFGLALFSR
jgi:hypothetical protein